MPSAEGYARMQARKKDDANKESQAIFDEAARERLFGKKEETSIYSMMTSSAQGTLTGDRVRTQASGNPLLAELEKEKAQEAEAARRRALALAGKPRKVMLCGDVHGQFKKVFSVVEAQDKKAGPFDALLCVGSFLPHAGSNAESAIEYLKGEKQAPRDCYFIDSGPFLLQAAPEGRTLNGNLHFLGAYGVKEVCGLRVAFLSGHYDPAVYNTLDVDYIGGAFTVKAINALQKIAAEDPQKRGIDVLLTCGWPADIDQGIADATQRPPEVADIQPWKVASAAPLAPLCLSLEPRYHIFGSADIFYQRPPFQTARGHHACRCIGLGQVGSVVKQKWLHALGMSPMAYMSKEELAKVPPLVTDCPFSSERAEPWDALDAPSLVDNVEVRAKAMVCLREGDLDQFYPLVDKLKDSPFVFDGVSAA